MIELFLSAALMASAAATPQAAAQTAPVDAAATDVPVTADAAVNVVPTLDTPIRDLIADPRSRAVLDKAMPGLSTDKNLPKFEAMSLRQFQPMTGGQLTPALLAKVGDGLAALSGGEAAPPPLTPAQAGKPAMIGR